MDGYKLTRARREALAEFRATLPAEDTELRICPPDCTVDHDPEREAHLARLAEQAAAE
jgi:hypothetical protein